MDRTLVYEELIFTKAITLRGQKNKEDGECKNGCLLKHG